MKLLFPAAVVLAALSAGCADGSKAIPAAPTIAPATITETFSGTLTIQNVSSHNFFVGTTGQVAITLTSVAPDVAVGLGLGVPSGFSCALTLGSASSLTAQASQTAHIKGTAITGTFCVTVYDVGNVAESVDYTITVNHS